MAEPSRATASPPPRPVPSPGRPTPYRRASVGPVPHEARYLTKPGTSRRPVAEQGGDPLGGGQQQQHEQSRGLLLVAGDKAGRWNAWYREAIPVAEQRYEIYLKERAQEDRGQA